eukprot:gene13432-28481_t
MLWTCMLFTLCIFSQKGQSKTPVLRSIAVSTLNNTACIDEAIFAQFILSNRKSRQFTGKYHLLLTITDSQLWTFLNWMSIAIILQYLPSPRIELHLFCPPPFNLKTIDFVENYLHLNCITKSKAELNNQTSSIKKMSNLRQRMKSRLQVLLEILLDSNVNDLGVMSYDLDAPWIKNMITFYDDKYDLYDFISQGTLNRGFQNNNKFKNSNKQKVFINFGGIYIKNSKSGIILAKECLKRLEMNIWNRFPDQDTVSEDTVFVAKR